MPLPPMPSMVLFHRPALGHMGPSHRISSALKSSLALCLAQLSGGFMKTESVEKPSLISSCIIYMLTFKAKTLLPL